MSIATIITAGYGSFGSIAEVVTAGYLGVVTPVDPGAPSGPTRGRGDTFRPTGRGRATRGSGRGVASTGGGR